MPELPDVEGFRQVLVEHGQDRRVRDVTVLDAGSLRGTTARKMRRALRGSVLEAPERRGKWLLARTDGPTLLLHFGMTGRLVWCPEGEPRHRHDRVVFDLDGGELRFRDMRKLQGLRLAQDEGDVADALAGLGPDALEVGQEAFGELLDRSGRKLKALLMDQTAIAGLGNLLADEILWRARIHPGTGARDLGHAERKRLHQSMRKVLRESVRARCVPPRPSWLTGVRDTEDAACPRCHGRLTRERVGGRATVWCPRCQPRPD